MIGLLKFNTIFRLTGLILLSLNMSTAFAEEEPVNIEYVEIEPVIITNYLKKSTKRMGFIQMSAQLTVKEKTSVAKLNKHMPLIRDYIIEFLSFTEGSLIKDISKRKQLRASLSTGIKEMLTEQVGEPLIEELVITHFMWN